MRHQPGGAAEIEDERDVVEPADRDPQPQPERADDVEGAEDRAGNPAERDEVHRASHRRVEERHRRGRLARGGDHREEQREVRPTK